MCFSWTLLHEKLFYKIRKHCKYRVTILYLVMLKVDFLNPCILNPFCNLLINQGINLANCALEDNLLINHGVNLANQLCARRQSSHQPWYQFSQSTVR